MITLESIFSKENLKQALSQVIRNKGAPGIDGMTVDEIIPWIYAHPNQLTNEIMSESYRFSPIRRVYIPKADGKQRPLGIPSVIDRVVQQAIAIALNEMYDSSFSNGSYGFRQNKSAHDAVKTAAAFLNMGYTYVIDLDLKSFFDMVNHEFLLQVLSNRIKDKRVLKLINKILKTEIIDGMELIKPSKGLTQGAPCSPVLANIILDLLDKELEKRGHKFCRYADDVIIFCKSQRAAERTYESISMFIEKKLHLIINKEKTKVGHINSTMKFLGFGFAKLKVNGNRSYRPIVHKKAKKDLRNNLRKILNKKCPKGIERTKEITNEFLMGWAHYFALGITISNMTKTESWIRHKIRAIYLKAWKRNSTKDENFRKLNTNSANICHTVANSSLGIWAKAKLANRTITKDIIHRQWGWMSITEIVKYKTWEILGY